MIKSKMPEDSELFTPESLSGLFYDVAEVYPLSVSAVSTIPWTRRLRGTADLIAGLTIIAAFVVLISDQVNHGEFEPVFHFSYLTNQTSYSNIVVLLAGAYVAFTRPRDTVLYATVRANFVAYAVMVGTVYNALLREPDHFGFHNEVTHVAIPVYLAADWLIRNNRPRISWNTVWIGVSYPMVWVGVTLIRGATTQWYPYFFLNPNTVGWPGVIAYTLAISVIFAGLIATMVALNHLQHRRLSTS